MNICSKRDFLQRATLDLGELMSPSLSIYPSPQTLKKGQCLVSKTSLDFLRQEGKRFHHKAGLYRGKLHEPDRSGICCQGLHSSELTHTALIPQGIQLSWPGQWPCVVKAGSGYSTGFLLAPVIVLLRVEESW